MKLTSVLNGRTTILVPVLAVLTWGCSGPAGGGGGTNNDPLPEYRLGLDEELDANVGAITAALNSIREELEQNDAVSDDETLLALKEAYVRDQSVAPSFPEYVAQELTDVQTLAQEITRASLGVDEELDANVQAITAADNEAVECAGLSVTFEDQGVLLALKRGYVSQSDPSVTFAEFVASTVEPEQGKADEICNTTLENASPELLALVQRLTEAGNRNAECLGQEPDLTDEGSLEEIKGQYFGVSVHAYESMTELASAFVAEVEEAVGAGCS